MCGSATLAIVVSTPCIKVASMIDAVIAVRLIRGPGAGSARAPPPTDSRLHMRHLLQEVRRAQMAPCETAVGRMSAASSAKRHVSFAVDYAPLIHPTAGHSSAT